LTIPTEKRTGKKKDVRYIRRQNSKWKRRRDDGHGKHSGPKRCRFGQGKQVSLDKNEGKETPEEKNKEMPKGMKNYLGANKGRMGTRKHTRGGRRGV